MPLKKYTYLDSGEQLDSLYTDLDNFITKNFKAEKSIPQTSLSTNGDRYLTRLKNKFDTFQKSQQPEKCSNLFSLDLKKNTLLHIAVEKGSNLLVRFLINAGLDIDRKNSQDETPLYRACVQKKAELVKLLLNANADPNLGLNKVGSSRGSYKTKPLYIAIGPEDRCLSSEDKIAAADIVKMLIVAGSNINEQFGRSKFTAIHHAVMDTRKLLVKTIVESGKADLSLVDKDGDSILHMVADYRNKAEQEEERVKMQEEKDIAELIIPHIKVINVKNSLGNTPLHRAVINANEYLVKLFLEKDYLFPQMKLLSIQNKAGMTPIHEAVREVKRSTENLKILLRVATKEDLAIRNYVGETALEMVNTLYDGLVQKTHLEVIKVEQVIESLLEQTAELLDNKTGAVLYSSSALFRIVTQLIAITDRAVPLFSKEAEQLQEIAIKVFFEAYELGQANLSPIKGRFTGQRAKAFKLRVKELADKIKKLTENVNEYFDDNYFNGLKQAKKLLEQSDYFVWKEKQLRLPRSFLNPEPRDFSWYHDLTNHDYQQAKLLHQQGSAAYNSRNYPEAISRLTLAISAYQKISPRHIELANAYWFLGLSQLAEPNLSKLDYIKARSDIKESIKIYADLQDYASLEKPYQALASTYIYNAQVASYEAQQKDILNRHSTIEEKRSAHLALAGLYKTIKELKQANNNMLPSTFSVKHVIEHESFHYSEAYKLTQGDVDNAAHVVLQHEIGIAKNIKLGTYNIQQCVVAIAYDPPSKKVVLSHFDRLSGPLTFIDQILKEFPNTPKIDLYLSGARDRANGMATSDSNIDQVLKQIYAHQDRFNIKSTDLGDKPSPVAIVFDPQSATLVASMPNHADNSLNSRAARMNLPIVKEGYLYPLNPVDFSKSTTERQIAYTLEQKESLHASYLREIKYKVNNPYSRTEAWSHNQIIYPSMLASKLTVERSINFDQVLFANFAPAHIPAFVSLPQLWSHFDISQQQSQAQNPDTMDVLFPQSNNNLFEEMDFESLTLMDVDELQANVDQDESPAKSMCHRQKRRVENNCLISWQEDPNKLDVEENNRLNRVKIDSTQVFEYLNELSEVGRSRLLQWVALHKIPIVGDAHNRAKVKMLIRTELWKPRTQRISTISSSLMQGMMAVNTLSDILNGRFGNVVMNVGFVGGNHAFNQLSQLVVNTGEKLIAQGSATLLGKALRTSGPIVRRVGSAFLAYDISNQIKTLKETVKNTDAATDAIAHIVGDSINIASDLVEAGIEIAEITEVIAGVSSVGGPISEAVNAIVMLGVQIFSAVRTVERQDHLVHLSGWEKFKEGWRAFLGIAPEAYVTKMVDLLQAYNRLLPQKLEFLQNQPNIKHLVFSALEELITNCRTVREQGDGCQGVVMCNPRTTAHTECDKEFPFIKNSAVDFSRKTNNFKLARAQPINPSGSQFICLPTGNDESFLPGPGQSAYRCANAIGISDMTNKTGASILFDLGDGYDFILGLRYDSNIFIAKNGFKKFYGGEKDDVFIVQANVIEGDFDGKEGINTVDLSGFKSTEKQIEIRLSSGYMVYGNTTLGLLNIHNFIGSKQTEWLVPACHTQWVDTQGAVTPETSDNILITRDDDCSYDIKFSLRPNTHVTHEDFTKGNFSYFICSGSGISSIKLARLAISSEQARHQIVFNSSLHDLYKISFNVASEQDSSPNTQAISFYFLSREIRKLLRNIINIIIGKTVLMDQATVIYRLKPRFALTTHQEKWLLNTVNQTQYQQVLQKYSVSLADDSFNITLSNKAEIYETLRYLIDRDFFNPFEDYVLHINYISPNSFFYFNDGTELKLGNKNNIYAFYNTSLGSDSIIKSYSNIARRLDITFFIHNPEENMSFTIGHSQHEIMTNDPKAVKSHLIGNGGENIFVINSGITNFIVSQLPLFEVVLYHGDDHYIDSLDLRGLAKQIKTDLNKTLELKLVLAKHENNLGDDLLLLLGFYKSDENSFTEVMTIRLKDAVLDDWYEKLYVVLQLAPMKIQGPLADLTLIPIPLEFSDQQALIILGPNDVEKNTAIILDRRFDGFEFFRDKNTLILTNSLAFFLEGKQHCQILIKDYFKFKNLVESIEFLDKKIFLSNLTEINTAMDYQHTRSMRIKIFYSLIFNQTHLFTQGLHNSLLKRLETNNFLSNDSVQEETALNLSAATRRLRRSIILTEHIVNAATHTTGILQTTLAYIIANIFFVDKKNKIPSLTANKPALFGNSYATFKAKRFVQRDQYPSTTALSTRLVTLPSIGARWGVELAMGFFVGFSSEIFAKCAEIYPSRAISLHVSRIFFDTLMVSVHYSLANFVSEVDSEHTTPYVAHFLYNLLLIASVQSVLRGLDYSESSLCRQVKKAILALYNCFFLQGLFTFFTSDESNLNKLSVFSNLICHSGAVMLSRKLTHVALNSNFFKANNREGEESQEKNSALLRQY